MEHKNKGNLQEERKVNIMSDILQVFTCIHNEGFDDQND